MTLESPRHHRHCRLGAIVALILGLVLPGAAAANGPFGAWLSLTGETAGDGWVEIPHAAALNPTGGITIEFWARLKSPASGCRSLVGKDFTQAYWIGICTSTLRSYLRNGANRDGGTIPHNTWVHIAVTSDGVTHKHFLNGVEVGSFAAGGPPTTSPDPVRIGGDVSWEITPEGDLDEVRIWRFALTAADIQSVMKNAIAVAQPGLVAVWAFEGNTLASVGPHDGVPSGILAAEIPAPPAGDWLTVPGIPNFRFKARINGTNVGTPVADCVPETVCVAGAIPTRTEIYVRVIGPRPNGYMHAQVIKFTVARVEVWIEQIDSGDLNYYELESVPGDTSVLPGIVDKTAFVP